MYALLSKKLVEESKRYHYLKTEERQSNTEKNKVYTKAFYKNKWYIKRNKLLDENGKLRTSLKLKCNFGFENYMIIFSKLE
jgi:hypothetical protein